MWDAVRIVGTGWLSAGPDGKLEYKRMAWELKAENGTSRVLQDGEYLLGRGEECDFLTPAADARVSRVHARLYVRGERLTVQDLASANGTCLNGRTLTRVEAARPGDLLQLGDTAFRLLFAPAGDTVGQRPERRAWLRDVPLWAGRLAAGLLAVSLFFTWFEALDFERSYIELVGDPAAWIALEGARDVLLIPLFLALLGLLAWLPGRTNRLRVGLLSGFLLGGALGVGTTWTVREQLAGWRLFDFGLEQTLGDGFTLFGWASALLLLAGGLGLAGHFLERVGSQRVPRAARARRISGG